MSSCAAPKVGLVALYGLALLLTGGCSTTGVDRSASHSSGPRPLGSLRRALTFHASFDGSTDADFAAGDPWLYQAPDLDHRLDARPGLPDDGSVSLEVAGGRHGGALYFVKRTTPVAFYRGAGNLAWRASTWSGTVSFWLRVDPRALPMGFCDPVNITPRSWDDGAFFVEFERRTNDAPFRLGAYPDRKIWNPQGRVWAEMSASEKPILAVDQPPFTADRWIHVVFTWENFNTGRNNGTTHLSIDGIEVGSITARTQTFTWDPAETRILLGVGFEGWLDDLAVFSRALTQTEIRRIRDLPHGIRSLFSP